MNLRSYWISKWLKGGGGGGGGKCKFRNRKRENLKFEREEDQKLDDWEERKEGKSKGNVAHSLPPLCFQSYAIACYSTNTCVFLFLHFFFFVNFGSSLENASNLIT